MPSSQRIQAIAFRNQFSCSSRGCWFAQSARSGVRTYFEATPVERQQVMLNALKQEGAPEGFSTNYRLGAEAWRDPTQATDRDRWIDRNDEANTEFLWGLARAHRSEIESLIA